MMLVVFFALVQFTLAVQQGVPQQPGYYPPNYDPSRFSQQPQAWQPASSQHRGPFDYQPQQQGSDYVQKIGGFLSRMKNSLSSAAASIARPSNPYDYKRGDFGIGGPVYDPYQSADQQFPYAPSPYASPNEPVGIFGRLKNMFSSVGQQRSDFPGMLSNQQMEQQYRGGPPASDDPYQYQKFSDPRAAAPQAFPMFQQLPQQQQPPPYYFTGQSAEIPPPPQAYRPPHISPQHPPMPFDAADPRMGQQQQPYMPDYAMPPPMRQVDPMESVPAEPQILAHEDSVVMVLKPRELFRKKQLMIRAGPNALQVFGDFESVLTRFKSVNSVEVIESSGMLPPQVLAQLQAITEEYSERDAEYDAVEERAAKCQNVFAREGNVHMGSIKPVVEATLSRIHLREGAVDALQSLSSRNVPMFLFSSGFGDIVTSILMQAGLVRTQQPGAAPFYGDPSQQQTGMHMFPSNIRVVSNFFRSSPDGIVRAFSQPVVHERNKNGTTAARAMGMQVPGKPYALVLGSHEDDVLMTEGVEGVKEQISIGFMEVTDDLPQRLPVGLVSIDDCSDSLQVFLKAFDVVVVGEGNFHYVRKLMEEILQLPGKGAKNGDSGRFDGLRKGLGMLFTGGNEEKKMDVDGSSRRAYSGGSGGEYYPQQY